MLKQTIKKVLRHFGYEIQRFESSAQTNRVRKPIGQPSAVKPVWPLPRRAGGPSDADIKAEFAQYASWHYAYEFEGGLSFPSRYGTTPDRLADGTSKRQIQRFKHFMPYVIEAANGSLKGQRILDIACNSGFWSIQCALLGADVVGFDARPELIEQANLIKSIVGIDHVEFKTLDFWEMNPIALRGQFDIVLNLGILYHLPSPLAALQLTKSMARKIILLDTQVHPSRDSIMKLNWEEPREIRDAHRAGVVANPSKSSIELMLRHIGVTDWSEIPVRTTDMPRDYLEGERASWLIKI